MVNSGASFGKLLIRFGPPEYGIMNIGIYKTYFSQCVSSTLSNNCVGAFLGKKILAFTRKRIFAIKLHHWCLIKSLVYSIPLVFIEVFTSLGKHCCGTWKKVYLALYPFEIFYNRLRPNRLFKLLEGFVPNKLLKNFPQERIKFLTE